MFLVRRNEAQGITPLGFFYSFTRCRTSVKNPKMKKLSADQLLANELFRNEINKILNKKRAGGYGNMGWTDNPGLGVTRNCIYLYARGDREPTFSAAITVANYLKIDLGKIQKRVKAFTRSQQNEKACPQDRSNPN